MGDGNLLPLDWFNWPGADRESQGARRETSLICRHSHLSDEIEEIASSLCRRMITAAPSGGLPTTITWKIEVDRSCALSGQFPGAVSGAPSGSHRFGRRMYSQITESWPLISA